MCIEFERGELRIHERMPYAHVAERIVPAMAISSECAYERESLWYGMESFAELGCRRRRQPTTTKIIWTESFFALRLSLSLLSLRRRWALSLCNFARVRCCSYLSLLLLFLLLNYYYFYSILYFRTTCSIALTLSLRVYSILVFCLTLKRHNNDARRARK